MELSGNRTHTRNATRPVARSIVLLAGLVAAWSVAAAPRCGVADIWCDYTSWTTIPARLVEIEVVGPGLRPDRQPPGDLVLQSDGGLTICTAQTAAPQTGAEISYLAIASGASPGSQETVMPGPDIDAVARRRRGVEHWAESVILYLPGPDPDSLNHFTAPTAALGPPDVSTTSPSECSLSHGGAPGIVSLGPATDPLAPPGLLVLRTSRIESGDELWVWEVGPATCSDAADGENDVFEVYISRGDIAGTSITGFDDIANDSERWVNVGASSRPEGGAAVFLVELP